MKSRQTRLSLLGLALGVLLALVITPQTRWLVRPQLALGLTDDAQRQRRFVRDHPDDYSVQLAALPPGPPSPSQDSSLDQSAEQSADQLRHARSLVPRFPENPSLRANLLRYAAPGLYLPRAESSSNFLSGKPDVPPHPGRDAPPTPAAQLAAFDADAAAGEKLDPDNAYFPFMRAVGLFAARRDADGLAAVTRAGTKTAWREYYADEVEGGWRILDGVDGRHEAVAGMAAWGRLLFPHYQSLRDVALLVTARAVRQEQAGRPEEGLALRRSLARCGDLMRAESKSYIGTLVGIAVTTNSQLRPGGAAPILPAPGTSSSPDINARLLQDRLDAYCNYVTRLGHPEAAREAQAQAKAAEQVRHITLAIAKYGFGSSFQDVTRLTALLVISWALVADMALLLLLGLAAVVLGRLPRMRARRPLPAGAAVGVWVALLLGAALPLLSKDTRPEEAEGLILMGAVFLFVPLALLSIYAVLRPAFRRPFGRAVLSGAVTLAALSALSLVAARGMHGADALMTAVGQMLSLSGSDGGPVTDLPDQQRVFLETAFAMALPLLLAVALSIAARVKRVPVSAGLVGGFRVWVPPLVCLLAALYGGLTLWTVRQEDAVNYGLSRSLHGEGQYLAELSGEPWPGPVR